MPYLIRYIIPAVVLDSFEDTTRALNWHVVTDKAVITITPDSSLYCVQQRSFLLHH